ncbi:hypothetical protein DPMN_174836 [Dreissena polymorpha]|uniref:Uncharacterized protein n=1 Tax=Dreissena polymorpha TaxID=45954 RepID=A0A9D4E729_DREPO|nr:hypothetical protein DPMN_174836 [Dreissena polymorpha]
MSPCGSHDLPAVCNRDAITAPARILLVPRPETHRKCVFFLIFQDEPHYPKMGLLTYAASTAPAKPAQSFRR